MLVHVGAFVAGVLTTLAPCVLPMLPVIVGGSLPTSPAAGGATLLAYDVTTARRRAVVVTASLAVSVVVFTLLLRASTALLGVPVEVWRLLSGGLLVALGLVGLFPSLWERAASATGLQERSSRRLATARGRGGLTGAVLTGAALGPVFTSCSPLYAYVIVTVLPASPVRGLVLLGWYVLGLSVTLLVVALLGQRVIRRAHWAVDPHGPFRRGLGLVFVLVGIAIITGLDHAMQAWLIEHSPVRPWDLDSGFLPDTS